jgi:hypothetical protein
LGNQPVQFQSTSLQDIFLNHPDESDYTTLSQCCQVAEIPAEKLKRKRKKKLAERICGRILAEFYQKVAEKGPQKIFKRSSKFFAMIYTYNVRQDEIKFDF